MPSRLRRAALVFTIGCAGAPDDCPVRFSDGDGDGSGAGPPRAACTGTDWADNADDCDDHDASVFPGAVEVCDGVGIDEDCSGSANDPAAGGPGAVDSWPDSDGDGFGRAGPATPVCQIPPGFADNIDDCDDDDPATFPAAAFAEGSACATDHDGDGFGAMDPDPPSASGTDCDDGEATVYPGARWALGDGLDNDCDGTLDLELRADFENGLGGGLTSQALPTFSDAQAGGFAASGRYSLVLGSGADVETLFVDTTACEELWWAVQVKRGPTAPQDGALLRIEGWTGVAWSVLVGGRIEGTGRDDAAFVAMSGAVRNEVAYHRGFRVRVRAPQMQGGAAFLIDDFGLYCEPASGPSDEG